MTDAVHETYLEAIRLVPAMQAARLNGSEADGNFLVQGYIDDATERGLPLSNAWAILCGAQSMAVLALITLVADVQDTTQADVVERMVEAALDQVATGAV